MKQCRDSACPCPQFSTKVNRLMIKILIPFTELTSYKNAIIEFSNRIFYAIM